jgi:hypothetical protein
MLTQRLGNSFFLVYLALFTAFIAAPQCNAHGLTDAESWNSSSSESPSILDELPRRLIHKIDTLNTPVNHLVSEICKRADTIAIFDKSAKQKTITGHTTDSSVAEALTDIFSTAQLHAKRLTDNILLVEPLDRSKDLDKRVNVGDFDNRPPLSIEEDRQRRERLILMEKLRRQRDAYWEQIDRQEQTSSPRAETLVPPPPPYTPSVMDSF